jgi:p-hydroxybenzoate 3-monooxygenase
VILENRSREYVEARIRAGVLEHDVAQLFEDAGVGERLRREGLVHTGVELQSAGERQRIAFDELTGKSIVVYGQTEIVKDLIEARLESGAPLLFEAEAVALHDLNTERPRIAYRHDGAEHELVCDVVAGCDGFHGVSRAAIPPDVLRTFVREYPYGWLGILAAVGPSSDELVYAHHERGFALLSMRSPELSRLYLQCAPDEDLGAWPDERVWEELQTRLAVPGWTLHEGPVLEKGVTPMRSFVAEPMRWGSLYLAGDAAHIVPPTGAKGLNLAVRDVRVLAEALVAWYGNGDRSLLDAYSETCLRRVWRAEHFSWWMTTMLHRRPDGDAFDLRLQLSQLRYLRTSTAAATSLAENYVGIERV